MTETDERRRADRLELVLPMRMGLEGEKTIAVSRNVSRTGVCIATANLLEIGAQATLEFVGPGADAEERHLIPGSIVRVETNAADPHGLWPYLVGIEFESGTEDLLAIAQAAKGADEHSADEEET